MWKLTIMIRLRVMHVRFCVGVSKRAIGSRNKESANGHAQPYILVGLACRDRRTLLTYVELHDFSLTLQMITIATDDR